LKGAGGTRAWIGLAAALAGGFLLAVAAARWLEGVVAQSLARDSYRIAESAPGTPAGPEAELPELPIIRWTPPLPEAEPAPPAPAVGEVVGRIRIPRARIDLAIFEGVSSAVLRKGPGHVPGTALPTLGSNCVITAHRDSHFRRLADAKVGDPVFVSGEAGEREYRLASRRVVLPTEVEVLAPTDDEQVTLVTCYPFRWIGPAPYRVVWQALPVDSSAKRTEDLPAFDSR
jgi:sortase A